MSSGFISEKDLVEARQKRQEEWEKVRSDDQPLERPEEPYDGRSLFDRLREQKAKKDLEFEEAHKLKNLIRGLDDDEVQFLELVDQNKMDAEKKQILEEEKEMKEFRSRVATLQEESVDKKIQTELKLPKTKSNFNSRISQKALLGVSIKRKTDETVKNISKANHSESQHEEPEPDQASEPKKLKVINTDEFDRGALKCIGILPGIGPYRDSSDSENSSDSDDNHCDDHGTYDLVGRKIIKKKACDDGC